MKNLSSPPLFVSLIIFILLSQVALGSGIDINSANSQQLQEINGIGPVLAERIIEMRQTCYFYPLSSLKAVKGIGPTILAKIEQEGKAFVNPPQNNNIILCGNTANIQKQQITENGFPLIQTNESEMLIIDINTASVQELMKIIHIGETRAYQIISLRPFYSLDDLAKINGIGPKSLEDIKTQGLAWVDPSLKKLEPELPERDLTAQANPFGSNNFEGGNQKSLGAFLMALGLAVFSGAIILHLKKKLKNITQ